MAVAKKESKPKNLAETLSALRSGKTPVHIGSLTEFDMSVRPVSTGNIKIDSITGVGGIPRGRVIELYGPPASGKTTTALQTAAELQKAGESILFLDYEKTLDQEYCTQLGIDVEASTFIYMQPRSFEQGANVFRQLMATGELGMGIIDSVAAMVTESELDAETGKIVMADRAKMMYQFMRQVTGPLSETGTILILLNHLLELVDASPMGQQLSRRGIKRHVTPGGRAAGFHASLRMEYKQIGSIRTSIADALSNEDVDVVTQTLVQVTTTKNKVAPPMRTCDVRVRYGKGFSQAHAVFDILVKHKIIKKSSSWYNVPEELRRTPEEQKFQGEESILQEIENDPQWMEKLRKVAQQILDTFGAEVAVQAPPAEFTTDEDDPLEVDGLTGEILETQ